MVLAWSRLGIYFVRPRTITEGLPVTRHITPSLFCVHTITCINCCRDSGTSHCCRERTFHPRHRILGSRSGSHWYLLISLGSQRVSSIVDFDKKELRCISALQEWDHDKSFSVKYDKVRAPSTSVTDSDFQFSLLLLSVLTLKPSILRAYASMRSF
jgi:hypothetical protein